MKIPSGTEVFDRILEGGYEKGIITTIYGPAATGKTTACLLAAIETVKRGGKAVFIDTENGFSTERVKQLTDNYDVVLSSIFLIKASSFEEQHKQVLFIAELVKKTGLDLIIVDTIGAHYRGVLQSDVKGINRMMAWQLDVLKKISKDAGIPVILTNQVYGVFGERDKVNIVGGDMLKNYSDSLIELKKLRASNRGAILRKHPSFMEKEIAFKIVERGLILL